MKIADPIAILGEDKACIFLENNNFRILERNFRKGYGEIDIICIDSENHKEKILVFVEVKTRTTNTFGTPFESITPWKLKTLIKTAEYYKLTHKGLPDSMRIDAVSVLLSSNEAESIEHIKNITGF